MPLFTYVPQNETETDKKKVLTGVSGALTSILGWFSGNPTAVAAGAETLYSVLGEKGRGAVSVGTQVLSQAEKDYNNSVQNLQDKAKGTFTIPNWLYGAGILAVLYFLFFKKRK